MSATDLDLSNLTNASFPQEESLVNMKACIRKCAIPTTRHIAGFTEPFSECRTSISERKEKNENENLRLQFYTVGVGVS